MFVIENVMIVDMKSTKLRSESDPEVDAMEERQGILAEKKCLCPLH